MIAKWYQMLMPLATDRARKNLCHSDRQRRCSARAIEQRLSPPTCARRAHRRRITGNPQFVIVAAAASGVVPTIAGGELIAK